MYQQLHKYYLEKTSYTNDLLSSSIIVILVLLGLPRISPSGNDLVAIMRSKVSLSSKILSSIIETKISAMLHPAGIVTLCDPET